MCLAPLTGGQNTREVGGVCFDQGDGRTFLKSWGERATVFEDIDGSSVPVAGDGAFVSPSREQKMIVKAHVGSLLGQNNRRSGCQKSRIEGP